MRELLLIITGLISIIYLPQPAYSLTNCGSDQLSPDVQDKNTGLICRFLLTPSKKDQCSIAEGFRYQMKNKYCIIKEQAERIGEKCGNGQKCLIEDWDCVSRRKNLGECGVNKTSGNAFEPALDLEKEIAAVCGNSYPNNLPVCISDIKRCLAAEVGDIITPRHIEACLAYFSSKVPAKPSAPDIKSPPVSNDIQNNIRVVKATIQNQEVNLDDPQRTLRLPGQEGAAGRYSLPIIIEYSDGTVDYLSYWVNYIPANPICKTDDDFSEFAGCNPNVCGKEYWRCPATRQTKEFATPGDGDCIKPAYNPSCANPAVQEEQPPQQTKEEDCEWRQDPYGECDWDRKQVYDYKTKYCKGEFTGEVERFNYHYVAGQCGYSASSPSQSSASSNNCPAPYPQCGGTAGLENYPRIDTIWVTPICENGNVTDYQKENLGNRGECS